MAMAFTECVCVEKAKGKEGLWTISVSGLWTLDSVSEVENLGLDSVLSFICF